NKDGKFLAAGSKNGTVRLWDVADGHEIQTMPLSGCTTRWRRGEKNWMPGMGAKTVQLQDRYNNHKLQMTKVTFITYISLESLNFSKDGKILTWGTSHGIHGEVHQWNIDGECETRVLDNSEGLILSMGFSKERNLVASGTIDGIIGLWDAGNGRKIWSLKGHTNWIQSVNFNGNGKRLISGAKDGTVRLRDVDSGRNIRILKGKVPGIVALDLNRDGKILASGSFDNAVRLWDVSSGRNIRSMKGHTSWVTSVSFSEDGKTLASGAHDKTVRLWDVNSGRETHLLKGHTEHVTSVSFSRDGKILASGAWDGTVRLWNVNSGHEIRVLKHHGWVMSVVFSEDGRILASSANRTIHLWEADSGSKIHTLKGHTSTDIKSLSFSANGKILASASPSDKTVRLWDVNNGRAIRTLKKYTEFPGPVRFSKDGKLLAVGMHDRDGTVWLWDMINEREIKILKGYMGSISSLSFSGDGKILASAGETIQIWDVSSGNLLKLFAEGEDSWLSCTADGLCWRYDDGELLRQADADGILQPLLPAKPAKSGRLRVKQPLPMQIEAGQARPLKLNMHNSGKGDLYWLRLSQAADNKPLLLLPPAAKILLAAGESLTLEAEVLAPKDSGQPQGRKYTLELRVHHAHDDGQALPVNVLVTVTMPKEKKTAIRYFTP
ncbi:MAG: WD40 repeat domain-containing protein, partial [Gammaproteobacteria bacterium]|nr:WD40 repeat domain-containing protein [Gammaproteobacteria bacterium]